jgi:hypothetical protein
VPPPHEKPYNGVEEFPPVKLGFWKTGLELARIFGMAIVDTLNEKTLET